MTQHGTIVNGAVVLDSPPEWPEGARVRVEVAEEADDDYGPPLEPTGETRAEFLAGLREDIAAIQAGVRGEPADVVFARIRAELGLPAEGA